MPKKRRLPRSVIGARPAQFAWAVPFVMAHRIALMTRPRLAAHERAELRRMVLEKPIAFQQAWLAMMQEAMHVQSRFATEWWTAALGVWSKGLGPVQRRAIANARRLAR
jgi:hypothetical protein